MPRGKRKTCGWEFEFRFEDGSRYKVGSLPDRVFTNQDIVKAIREYVLPVLKTLESRKRKK